MFFGSENNGDALAPLGRGFTTDYQRLNFNLPHLKDGILRVGRTLSHSASATPFVLQGEFPYSTSVRKLGSFMPLPHFFVARRYWILAAISLCAVVVLTFRSCAGGPGATAVKFDTVRRGTLLVTVNATGTLEPEEVIDVGAQVAGQIASFGKDLDGNCIDYGSRVEEGTVLAQIDSALYAADVAEIEAQLQKAAADLVQMRARLTQAESDWTRAQRAGPGSISPTAFDGYKAGFEIAKANVAVAEATIAQLQATRSKAQRNLSYCTITSPVKGVIIDRRVNIGQTVVSSLNAPSLFLLAKDLSRMQLWVSVNEADIGKIHPGQKVTFTTDTFPGQIFEGVVDKVRLNATMTQNVVTYTVDVTTNNNSRKLLPYLTANVRFEIRRGENVLLVPNAALRWKPREDQIDPNERGSAPTPPSSTELRRLWIASGAYVRPLPVEVGDSDGIVTEVLGSQVHEGMAVAVGELTPRRGEGPQDVKSPFTPQMGRGR